MKELAKIARREYKVQERRELRAEKRELTKGERLKLEKKRKRKLPRTWEWTKLKKEYPDSKYTTFSVYLVHPELKRRFATQCIKEEHTASSKIRRLIIDLLDEKIDDLDIQQKMAKFDIAKGFGKTSALDKMCISFIPYEIVLRFRKWCTLRGVSASFKIKQLMAAYLLGFIK